MYPLPLYYFLSQFWIPPLPLLPVTFLNDPYAMAVNDKSVRSTHYCLLCQRDHDPAKWRNRERTEATSLQIAIFNVRYVAITSDHNTRSYKQKKRNKHPQKTKLEDDTGKSNENFMTCATTKMKSSIVCAMYLSKWDMYTLAKKSIHTVGNKAKGQISKRVFQENRAPQIFRKPNISYPLTRTHTCVY